MSGRGPSSNQEITQVARTSSESPALFGFQFVPPDLPGPRVSSASRCWALWTPADEPPSSLFQILSHTYCTRPMCTAAKDQRLHDALAIHLKAHQNRLHFSSGVPHSGPPLRYACVLGLTHQ